MREIKFRAKAVRNDKWVFGALSYCNFNYGVEYAIAKTELGSIYTDRINQNTIGQYTGLKDRDSKEIYEGDIVEYLDCLACDYYREDQIVNKGKFYFSAGQFFVSGRQTVTMDDLIYDSIFDGKVIGNIYDNPELLEE